MPKPVGRSQRYMPGLDGLRAIAVLAVIAYHLDFGWAPGGLLGVGVFFTLSGYLITDLLLGTRAATGSLKLGEFWIRRARRLLPALYLMIVAVVAWVTLFERTFLSGLRGDVIAAFFYVSNWWNIAREASYFARFGPPPPLEHLWSLAVEEQFYLIWPWLVWLVLFVTRKRPVTAGLALTGLALGLSAASVIAMWVLYQPGIDPTRVYEGTDTRAFGLLIGAALAVVWPSRALSASLAHRSRVLLDGIGVVGLVIIALLIWRTSEYSPFMYHGGILLLTLATTATVAALAHPATVLGTAVGWAPLRWIGVRSYGIYLWHWPIIVLTDPPLDQEPTLTLQALQVAATIIVAAISWRFVEEPIRRGAIGNLWGKLRSGEWRRPASSRRQRRRRFAGTAVALVLVGVLALDAAGLSGIVAPQTSESSKMTAAAQKEPSHPNVSSRNTVEVPGKAGEEKGSGGDDGARESTNSADEEQASGPGDAASKNSTSCESVAYIGDSTSEGMVLPNYLPNPKQRLDAQYARVGATKQFFEISGARSIVETLSTTQASGLELVKQLNAEGFEGCWVIGLGTNDAANVYVGSAVALQPRVDQMMKLMGDQPVLWVTVRSLVTSGPYADENMQKWNQTLEANCDKYPNLRVFDWASLTRDDWFIEDGTHYTSEGYRHRAR
ncbi:MAG TPA: acyltransferase family protein, partial [Rubrobacter sp.]|nr:acyltransferase family protein [Rubrobacter sp.]